MSAKNEGEIVVKRQNFDKAMNSIKAFAESSKEHEPLDRVSYSGGFLGLGDHKVTGYELNNVVSQVEDQLVDLKNFDLGVLDIITNVYKALAALDKEHISGILIAANAAKVASDKATKNVEAIQKIIKVLQDFKGKLDKLEHLMDVDKAWKLLEEQKNLLQALGAYKDELSKIQHIKDIDALWNDVAKQVKSLAALDKTVHQLSQALEKQAKTIEDFSEMAKGLSENQRTFIESANQHLSERQASIDRYLAEREIVIGESLVALTEKIGQQQDVINKKAKALSHEQSATLASMDKTMAERLSQLDRNQKERLTQIDKTLEEKFSVAQSAQANTLAQIAKEHNESIEAIEKHQAARLDQISKEQSDILARLVKDQSEKIEEINKSLEDEKATLNNQVQSLAQKAKIAYIVAGSSIGITVIHILLSLLGVL